MDIFFIGRNIGKDDQGYYITFSDRDLTAEHDKSFAKNHHSTYKEAKTLMDHLINNGSHWFDARFDPTI